MSTPRGSLSALSHRPFRIYLSGQAISLVGVWMQQVAQSLVILRLTKSVAVFATVNLISSIPMIAFTLLGGVIADRFDRRKILIVTQVGLMVLAFIYAAIVANQVHLWQVYVLSFCIGLVAAFDLPASQGLVPELVPPPAIASAVAVNQSVFHGARFIGPALGGVIVGATSLAFAFVANGVSYIAVIVSLMMIRTPTRPPRTGPAMGGWAAFVDGLRYLGRQRRIRALIGLTALTTFFIFTFLIVFSAPFVSKVLKGGDKEIGWVMGGSGLGAMVGSLSVLSVPGEKRGKAILLGVACIAAMLFAVSASPNVVVAVILVTVLAGTVALTMGLSNQIIQLTVPNELRGRVMSVYMVTFIGVMPIGGVVLGVVSDHVGLAAALRVMAVAYVIAATAWLLRARIHRPDDQPPIAPPTA